MGEGVPRDASMSDAAFGCVCVRKRVQKRNEKSRED
jgi:hypothetical protein